MNDPEWTEVAERDKQLRQQVDQTSEVLQGLRWAHTLAIGVPYAVYARECGVSENAVRAYAKAHELRTNPAKSSSGAAGEDGSQITPADALIRVSMTQSRYEVVEALAAAHSLSATTVAKEHAAEVREVLDKATEYAEMNGTSVRAEADRIVARADADDRPGRQGKRRGPRTPVAVAPYAEFESHLSKAGRELRHLMETELELDGAQKRALVDTVGALMEILTSLTARFARLSDSEV